MEIEVNNNKYKIIENKDDCFEKEEFSNKCSDYFETFDYIVGDYAYSKLRLKGFNKKTNKNFKNINDFNKLDKYLEENCSFRCKYFVLEKISKND